MPTAHHSLPSPSSSASLSPPRKAGASLGMDRHHSESGDESDPVARSALEIRREKNRIKQRNLRLRRANQMADLETTVTQLRNNSLDLEDRLALLEAREAALSGWVRDLESALVNSGQRDHVEELRRVWAPSAGGVIHDHHHHHSSSSSSMMHRSGHSDSSSSADPLSTLASAASSYQTQHRSEPRRWSHPTPRASTMPAPPAPLLHSEHDRKRRRSDLTEDDKPVTASAPRLPSPSRMRIAELVLPLPRPQQSAPAPGDSWQWGHLPALEHSFPYDKRPSHSYSHSHGSSSNSHDARPPSPLDRRPISASSAGTSRTWTSPVQSFEIRL